MPPLQPLSYSEEIDFTALALQDSEFAKVLDAGKGKINWHDAQTVKQITKSLLKRDFGLRLDLPEDRLCPPIPVRYNYVRWVQDLIDTTSESYSDTYNPNRQVLGLDIGTGASAIYALLAASTRPNWRMYGTDIDLHSLNCANRNLALNSLTSRIRTYQSSPYDSLIPLDALKVKQLDFTICNPPFFASREEMQASIAGHGKDRPPNSVCTGAEVEMVYPSHDSNPGGDLGFVLRMVDESVNLRDRVQWYTSMLGKLASVGAVVKHLKEVGITNWAVSCLIASGKTRRWGVAWSWGDYRPRNDVARQSQFHNLKELMPFPTSYTIHLDAQPTPTVTSAIDRTLNALDIRWIWREERLAGLVLARENVWSRSARRKKNALAIAKAAIPDEIVEGRLESSVQMDTESDDDGDVALVVKVSIEESEERIVVVRWLRGDDHVLYESFCGMLKRAVDNAKST